MRSSSPSGSSWLLPVACAVVPAIGVHAAWWISREAGYIPDCIPHLEGCTSISRAGRQGSANVVFKALMLPAAALQALNWILAARWIERHARTREAVRGLVPLGIVAGVALAVYASFLGSEGAVYGWLRRYGITFYFAATFCAMLVFIRGLRPLPLARTGASAMTGLCLGMLALGLANVLAPLFGTDELLRERLRDAMEWQLGALFCGWFLVQAASMRRIDAMTAPR
jgi:hypothetical protein